MEIAKSKMKIENGNSRKIETRGSKTENRKPKVEAGTARAVVYRVRSNLKNCPLPWGEGVPRRRFHQPERDG
jgi:hypothetical protein